MTMQKMGTGFAVVLLFASFHVTAAERPKNYRKLVLTPLPASDSNPSAQTSRPVQLDANIVPEKPVSPGESQQWVYLELFGDAKFNISLQQSCSQDGCSWVGTIDDQPGSTVVLLRKNTASLVGNVRDAKGRTFQISPQITAPGKSPRGKHVILRLPPQVFPDERSPAPAPQEDGAKEERATEDGAKEEQLPPRKSEDAPPPSASDPASSPDAKKKHGPSGTKAPQHSSDEVAQLDVLVLYTQNAKSVIEGPASQALATKTIQDEIRLAAEVANQSFKNSDIKISLSIAAIQQVDYNEMASKDLFSEALTSLSDADGGLENVFALKKKYNAHLVSLWIAEKPDAVTATSCGLGYVMERPSKSFGQYAFSVVNAQCGLANFSFAHEVGHNLGAQHNREAEANPSARAYNFGYIPPSRKFRCVMSYACSSVTNEAPCVRQPIWSSPDHRWLGEKTGVEEGAEGAADNARELNENRFLAADYWRATSNEGSPTASTDILYYTSYGSSGRPQSNNKYILTNASRNGTEECLIMGGNGYATHPSRHLWGGKANGFCGLGSHAELLANKQAVWTVIPLGDNKYVFTNASRNGTEECLIMSGNGQAVHPSRHLWDAGQNGFCGLSSAAELLANKQAVWTAKPLGDHKYILTNASRNGTEECLIMSGNGKETHPRRYLWGGGANGFCGLSSAAELLANKQAVWTITPIP